MKTRFDPFSVPEKGRAFRTQYEAAVHQKAFGAVAHLATINAARVKDGLPALPPPPPDHLRETKDLNNRVRAALDTLHQCLQNPSNGCSKTEKTALYSAYRLGRLGMALVDAL